MKRLSCCNPHAGNHDSVRVLTMHPMLMEEAQLRAFSEMTGSTMAQTQIHARAAWRKPSSCTLSDAIFTLIVNNDFRSSKRFRL